MKLLISLLLLLPLWAEAQLMEPLDKWGVRTAYTRTNGSRSFVFIGASLNSTVVDRSGLAAVGAKVYAGAQIGKPDSWKIIPEVGADTFFYLTGRSRRFAKHRSHNTPRRHYAHQFHRILLGVLLSV